MKLLPLELNSIDNDHIIEPDYEMETEDTVVGTMPEMSKKLFTLGILLEKDANQHMLDSKYCMDKSKKLELEAKAQELAIKCSVVKALVWIDIRDTLGLWGTNLGVRCGFKVVTYPNQNDNMPPFLKRLFE